MKKVILGAILAAISIAATAGIVIPNCMSDCATQNIGPSPCVAAGTCGGTSGLTSQTSSPPTCTWTNVTSARALNATYTNSTGQMIQVVARVYGLAPTGNAVVQGMGVASYYAPGGGTQYVNVPTFDVPVGASYEVTNEFPSEDGVSSWYECR